MSTLNDIATINDHLRESDARIDELETALLGVLDTVSTLADIIASLKSERTTAPKTTTRTTTTRTDKPKHVKATEGVVTGTVVRHAGGAREGYGLLVKTSDGERWVNCVRANHGPALFKGLTEGQSVSFRVRDGGFVVTDNASKAA